MSDKLIAVGEKISTALRKEGTAPPNLFTLGTWLARVLSSGDFDVLDEYEREVGEDKANEWLAGVLTTTNLYQDAGDGHVSA